jgi:hypothetical protein
MMGTQARLFTPLPPVTLEELVPADHFYRHLDRVLDLAFVCDVMQDCSAVGLRRPSVDPQVFIPMRLKGGGTYRGYQTHCVVDGGTKRISVGVLMARVRSWRVCRCSTSCDARASAGGYGLGR